MADITDEELALAAQYRAEGLNWNAIGTRLGRYGDSLRRRLDPEYQARRNAQARHSYRKTNNSPLLDMED